MARKAIPKSKDSPIKRGRGRPPKAAAEAVSQKKATKSDRKQAATSGPLASTGHNLRKVKEAVVPFAERYNSLLNAKEENAAEYMSDVKELLEEAANDLGCPRKIVRQALQDQRRQIKQGDKEAELEPTERDQLETLRDALGLFSDTPLGQAAVKKAAPQTNGKHPPPPVIEKMDKKGNFIEQEDDFDNEQQDAAE